MSERPWWAERYTLRNLFKGFLSTIIVASTCIDVLLLLCGVIELTTQAMGVLAIMTNMSGIAIQHYFGRDSDEDSPP